MTFQNAVEAVNDLSGAYSPGLRALREGDRNRIRCANTRRLSGSVDLDEALRRSHPNDPLWDYGIGWTTGASDQAIWVEVHPASSGHVADVVKKVTWLKEWLKERATPLLDITRENKAYVWLASGGVSLQRGSRQARQLAMAGVSFPVEALLLRS